jgi:hypothetical protein
LSIIADGRATQFDPDVVDAFFAAEATVLQAKEQGADDSRYGWSRDAADERDGAAELGLRRVS